MAGLALLLMAVFVGLMQASLFSEVGGQSYSYDYEHNRKITINFVGLAFLTGQD